MQVYTRHQWRNSKVKSDGSRSKGLTPCTCLCYRCCALEQGTFKDPHCALKGAKQSPRPFGPLLSKYFIQGLSFVTLVRITQTATRVGPNYTLHSRN